MVRYVLHGSEALVIDCTQRLRVLADQELENCAVVVVHSRVMKGCEPSVIGGAGQQAPLPRVELDLRDHQMNEYQWRRAITGVYDSGPSGAALVEYLIDRVTVHEQYKESSGGRARDARARSC